jgi:cation:H+ antiporter
MDTFFDIGRLLLGGVLLYLGAELLIKGSAGLARAFGVRPIVIGLTVVAYGTSAPELSVSVAAILDDSSPIVLGNVIGSCIANVTLILGLTALISPPHVESGLIRREIPIMLLSAAVVPLLLIDGAITRVEGIIMLLAAAGFTLVTLTLWAAQPHIGLSEGIPEAIKKDKAEATLPQIAVRRLRLVGYTVIGLGLLTAAGDLFVVGARGLALALGMSESLVGLTVVAIATALPELAASIVAALRGHSALAVGNLIGANIFNVFFVLGVTSTIRPVEGALRQQRLEIAFLVAATLAGALFMRGSRRVSRGEGVILLILYAGFVAAAAMR